MSYYFAIIGTKDNPLFTHEFGTSRGPAGDGTSTFRDDAKHMNQFIIHSALDIVEEVQWTNGAMYFKTIDRFQNNHISLFMTGSGAKFLLLHNPDPTNLWQYSAAQSSATSGGKSTKRPTSSAATSIVGNPTSPATEEAIRQFFSDVYEMWCKTIMNPFYIVNMEITSPVFRQRVAAAARKYL